MTGADWDAIFREEPELEALDLSGLDMNDVAAKLGALSIDRREQIVAAIDGEKAKAIERGRVIDLGLDVLRALVRGLA
jgi:hypothetical protein